MIISPANPAFSTKMTECGRDAPSPDTYLGPGKLQSCYLRHTHLSIPYGSIAIVILNSGKRVWIRQSSENAWCAPVGRQDPPMSKFGLRTCLANLQSCTDFKGTMEFVPDYDGGDGVMVPFMGVQVGYLEPFVRALSICPTSASGVLKQCRSSMDEPIRNDLWANGSQVINNTII